MIINYFQKKNNFDKCVFLLFLMHYNRLNKSVFIISINPLTPTDLN